MSLRETPRLALSAWTATIESDLNSGSLANLLSFMGNPSEVFESWDTPFRGFLLIIAAGREQELFRAIALMRDHESKRRVLRRLVLAAVRYPRGNEQCDRSDGATVREVLHRWELARDLVPMRIFDQLVRPTDLLH